MFFWLYIESWCGAVVKSLCTFFIYTNNLNEFGTIFAVTLNRIIKPQRLWHLLKHHRLLLKI